MKKVRRTNPENTRRGFSLTELLIVMAILVLLISLVGPRLLGSKKKADVNSVRTQIGLFQSALERYAIEMNKFPNTEEGLAALVKDPTAGGTESEEGASGSAWDGPYLKTSSVPNDPWGKPYRYEYPPTHGKDDLPDIWSLGPDGRENTEDDVVSWKGTGGAAGGDTDPLDDPLEAS